MTCTGWNFGLTEWPHEARCERTDTTPCNLCQEPRCPDHLGPHGHCPIRHG